MSIWKHVFLLSEVHSFVQISWCFRKFGKHLSCHLKNHQELSFLLTVNQKCWQNWTTMVSRWLKCSHLVFCSDLLFGFIHFITWIYSSHQRCYIRKGVLENFAKFTGKHLCQSLFLNKIEGLRPAAFFKMRLWHRGAFLWILRIFKNTIFTPPDDCLI